MLINLKNYASNIYVYYLFSSYYQYKYTMENNILNTVKSYFTAEVTNKLGANMGESPDAISRGLDLTIPTVLLGLQGKTSDGLQNILQSGRQLLSSFDMNDLFGNYFGTPAGTDNSKYETQNLLTSIFGERLPGIISSIASYLGMRNESIAGLMGATLPAALAGITHNGSNWDLESISSTLNANRSGFAAALPTGLGLGTFGSSFAEADEPVHTPPPVTVPNDRPSPVEQPSTVEHTIPPARPVAAHAPVTPVEEERKGAGWWWLLIPLILLGLWLFFGKGCENKDEVVLRDTTATTDIDTSQMQVPADREFVDVTLPDGNTLKAYPAGIEEQLIAFLQSDYKNMSDSELENKWFDFDNLNFETNTAIVTEDSRQQLENIAAILRMFPDAKIKIGGYTDRTGDENINEKISEERAEAVKKFLEEKGLGTQVIDAEGYGSEFATVAAEASDAERAVDRRVSVSVRK